jgi:membrane-associated phospholipid phosphatase
MVISNFISYVVLAFFLCSQVSLAQTLPDSVPAGSRMRSWSGAKRAELSPPDSFSLAEPPLVLSPTGISQANVPLAKLAQRVNIRPLLATPAILLGAGFLTHDNPEYLESNEVVQEVLHSRYSGFHTKMDNHTRYVPLAAVYGLNLAGLPGKHDLLNLTMLFGLSSFINNTLTNNLKRFMHERRPDKTNYESFPSGHTSTAFANAELLHQEFKDQSAWYSVGGYSFAAATGTLRMLNNRHWLSDVIAGAGVGMLSTRLAYLLYPWLQQTMHLERLTKLGIAISPMYQQGSYGLRLGLQVKPSRKIR